MQIDNLTPFRLAVRGVFWGASKNVINRIIRVAVFVVLARLLGPEDFGLVALAIAMVLLADLLVIDGGWGHALVRREDVSESALTSVHIIVLALSVVLAVLTALSATAYAAFVGEPEVASLVYWLLPVFPLAGLRVVPHALLTRRFDFRSIALASNVGTLVGGAVAIAMALNGAGVAALIANQLVTKSVATLGILLSAGWRPTAAPSWTGLDAVRAFVPKTMIVQISQYLDVLVIRSTIGAAFGPASVGHYAIAIDLRGALRALFVQPASQVVVTSVRRLRMHPARLRDGLLRGIKLLSVIVFPAALGASLVAADVITLILGSEWAPAASLVQFLMLALPAMALGQINTRVQYAQDRAGLVAMLKVGTTMVLALLLWTLPFESIMGVIVLLALRPWLLLPLHAYLLIDAANVSVVDMLKTLWPGAFSSLVMAGAVYAMRLALPAELSPAGSLAISVTVGAVVYGLVLRLVAKEYLHDMKSVLAVFIKDGPMRREKTQ